MIKKITAIPQLPPRQGDAHKGIFGRVLVIGGSRTMIGAPALTANAALRSGVGLVRIAVPAGIQQSVARLSPCSTTVALAEDDAGRISRAALPVLLENLAANNCMALGPGLGQQGDLTCLLQELLCNTTIPAIIDADGLNNLAKFVHPDFSFSSPIILTPHPGEMQRLWRALFREKLPLRRSDQAETLARRCRSVVVLKGAGTVVTDGARTYINETGNPGMATGGSGDVLTGIIAALLARQDTNMSPLDAAVLGVFIHGRAGDLAAADLTETALIATDLIEFLPLAWASIRGS